ncbi:MAG: hypothetical protein DHS20C06_20140 [Hyphobacterium sp.]|nr:MAG: hypothetical protein DHS20C06_20140 [Hyphobacterium sp.]
MTDIFDRIKKDHDAARALVDEIEATTDKAGKQREALFETFKIELWTHNKVEEATFYARLESKGEEDESLEAKNEHHMLNSLIEELDTMPKDNVEWGQKFHALAELLSHHMDEEEEEFFELGRKEFSESEAEKLGEQFDTRKKAVKPALAPVVG